MNLASYFVNSRGPEESDTLIKESGFVYSDTYKWQKKTKVTLHFARFIQLDRFSFLS